MILIVTFPHNDANGHHLVNKGSVLAVCLEVGTRAMEDVVTYPDIDNHGHGTIEAEGRALGEEAREPRRTIPRAILGAVLIGGAFYILTSTVEVVGATR